MNLNPDLSFKLDSNRFNPILTVANIILGTSLSILVLTIALLASFTLNLTAATPPPPEGGLLNLQSINAATSLLEDQTVRLLPETPTNPQAQ